MSKPSRKIPISSAGKLNIEISGSDWNRIECAYDAELSSGVRRLMHDATQDFVDLEVFERTAGSAAKTKEVINGYRLTAQNFRSVLSTSLDAYYARHLVRKNFEDRRLIPEEAASMEEAPDPGVLVKELGAEALMRLPASGKTELFHSLTGILTSFEVACKNALSELESSASTSNFKQRDSWNQWIRRLTAIAASNSLPTAVRKDLGTRYESDKPSGFERLVGALQECLPEASRQSLPYAESALASAIVKARSSGFKDPGSHRNKTRRSPA